MELPIPKKLTKLWDEWHLRGCIMLSLSVQAFLVSFASSRRRSKATLLLFLVWSAYLLADWVAAVAIGSILNSQGDVCESPEGNQDDLFAFWASFLLLHLGGPDSITSFALEDNELWIRHLLGLFLQGLAAAYSMYLTLPSNELWLPTILVLVVGIAKYGERTYAFYLASLERFGASGTSSLPLDDQEMSLSFNDSDGLHLLQVAYKLFQSFKVLTVGRYLSSKARTPSRKSFLEANHTTAFTVVEYELSMLYEVLHTKVVVARRRIGYILRFISFCFIVGASTLFLFVEKNEFGSKFDIGLTYALLIGAIVLDSMSFIQLISSFWTLGSLKNTWRRYIPSMIVKRRRWSDSFFGYNMVSYCLDEHPIWVYKLAEFLKAKSILDKIKIKLFSSSEIVGDDLKARIFNQLKKRSEDLREADVLMECFCRGHWTLDSPRYDRLKWSIVNKYTESLLLWHLATEICFHREKEHNSSTKSKRTCKLISDYMFYLLVMQPSMLAPVLGNWDVVFQDTCAEAKRFFEKYGVSRRDRLKAFEKMMSVETKSRPAAVKGLKSKSVMFDAVILAKELEKLEDRWEVMDQMWVELMCYAAVNCRPIMHAQQPSKGGELLTLTWLLMYHLGFGFQFVYSKHD